MKVIVRWKTPPRRRRVRVRRAKSEVISLLEVVGVSVGSVATYYIGKQLMSLLR